MYPLGNPLQSGRAMIHGIHRGNNGQQHLGGTDITGCFLAADMLLAGLQRQAIRWVALTVLGYTYDPTRHHPRIGLLRGKEGRVRPTKAQRYPKALTTAHRNIGIQYARCFQQH